MEQIDLRTKYTAAITPLMGETYPDLKAMIKLGELFAAQPTDQETTEALADVLSKNIEASLDADNNWRALAALASTAAAPRLIPFIPADLMNRTLSVPTRYSPTPDMADQISNGLDFALKDHPEVAPALTAFLDKHPTVKSAHIHGQTRTGGFDPAV